MHIFGGPNTFSAGGHGCLPGSDQIGWPMQMMVDKRWTLETQYLESKFHSKLWIFIFQSHMLHAKNFYSKAVLQKHDVFIRLAQKKHRMFHVRLFFFVGPSFGTYRDRRGQQIGSTMWCPRSISGARYLFCTLNLSHQTFQVPKMEESSPI